MTLSPTVAEWVAAYEQEHGHRPADLVLQIAEHIEKVAGILATQGAQDAEKGRTARPAGFFRELFCEVFRIPHSCDTATADAVAGLWQSFYMEGYERKAG